MSPRQLTCVTRKLVMVDWKIHNSSAVMNLHCSLIDVERLRRTHMLVVEAAPPTLRTRSLNREPKFI